MWVPQPVTHRARARSDIPGRSAPLSSRSHAFMGKPVSLTLCPTLSAPSPPAAAESIAASLLQPARNPRVIRVAASPADSTFLEYKTPWLPIICRPYKLSRHGTITRRVQKEEVSSPPVESASAGNLHSWYGCGCSRASVEIVRALVVLDCGLGRFELLTGRQAPSPNH
jgi:hypothetical protein